MSKISKAELAEVVAASIPWADDLGLEVEALEAGRSRVRLPFNPRQVRPGGTLGGPALLALASFAAYAAVLSVVGRLEETSATTLTSTFLKPAVGDVVADALVLNQGRRLVYTEVRLCDAEDPGRLLAHVTATYAPPRPPAAI